MAERRCGGGRHGSARRGMRFEQLEQLSSSSSRSAQREHERRPRPAPSASAFGTPKKATGTPYVFGMINDETGAVTFPEARQGAIAAENYVNNYLGGINGHPIQIDNCVGDGTPATAARCANELVAKHPIAILGAADVGAPASIPIYAHANLAYIGGIPFTPVPETAPNSIQFWSVSIGDNLAAAVYAGKTLGVKKAAIMYFSNPQGSSLLPQITPVLKAAGVTSVKDIPLSPTSPDPSPQAALVARERRPARLRRHPERLRQRPQGAEERRLHRQDHGHRPVWRAAGDRGRRRRRQRHVHRLPVPAADRQQHAGAAVPGRDQEVGGPGHAHRLDLDRRLRHGHERPAGAEHDQGHPDDRHDPHRVQVGQQPSELPLAPVHVRREARRAATAICNDYYLMNQIKNGQLTQPSATNWVSSKGYFQGVTADDRHRVRPPRAGGPGSAPRVPTRLKRTTMSSYILFLILGLGAGATYAILGQGLVLKYRSAGVVDFAHGAVAMFIAYVFVNLRTFGQLELPVVLIPHQISLNGGHGLNTALAIVISLVYAAILGLVLYVLVYRPLRGASPLTRVCASVGIMLGLQAIAVLNYSTQPVATNPIFPAPRCRSPRHLPGGPALLHRRRRRHLGRARAHLPLLPLRPGHPGRRRERPRGRAHRHLRQPHRAARTG